MSRTREKSHRLSRERYMGHRTTAFTTCLQDRHALFEQARRADDFAAILLEECEKQSCDLAIACFMPDHVHALIRGRADESSALDAFYAFKLRSGIQLDRFCRPARWQKDFYDHVVRWDGDWRGQAKYIALNPVRAGLVEDMLAYPFTYTSLGDREQFILDLFWD